MPVSKPLTRTVTPRRKAAPPALFTPPVVEQEETIEVSESPVRPTTRLVDGKAVISEEAVNSPLPTRDKDGNPIRFKTFVRLHLDDGSSVLACRDCLFTCELVGHMTAHRQNEHPRPSTKPDRRKKPAVLPDGYAHVAVNDNVLNMTFAEVIEAADLFQQFGEIAVGLQAEVERLTAELAAETALRVDAERNVERLGGFRDRAQSAEAKIRRIQTALDRAGFALKVENEE